MTLAPPKEVSYEFIQFSYSAYGHHVSDK